jgi:hypothetical protein
MVLGFGLGVTGSCLFFAAWLLAGPVPGMAFTGDVDAGADFPVLGQGFHGQKVIGSHGVLGLASIHAVHCTSSSKHRLLHSSIAQTTECVMCFARASFALENRGNPRQLGTKSAGNKQQKNWR